MARTKIELPKKRTATLHIPVRITDINYGNHLGNDSLVGIIHEARMQFFRLLGFTEFEVYGTSLIMSELSVIFRNESFYGDQLEIGIFIGEVSRVGFDIFYQVTVQREERVIEVALAKTGMVCFDYAAKKVVAVPRKLTIQFEQLHDKHPW